MPITYRLTAAACALAADELLKFILIHNTTHIRLNRAAAITKLPYLQLYRHGKRGRFKLLPIYPIQADIASLIAFLRQHDAEKKLCDRRHLRKPIDKRRAEIAALQKKFDAMKRWPHYDAHDADTIIIRTRLRRIKYYLKRALAR
jgi:hypothetical protein